VFVAVFSSRAFHLLRNDRHCGKSSGILPAPLYCFYLRVGGLWDFVGIEVLDVSRSGFNLIYIVRHKGLVVVIGVLCQPHLLFIVACGLEVILVKFPSYVHILAA